ncbi:hypothetical protein CsSME_00011333 [Camellia sinensis var. sinensis]
MKSKLEELGGSTMVERERERSDQKGDLNTQISNRSLQCSFLSSDSENKLNGLLERSFLSSSGKFMLPVSQAWSSITEWFKRPLERSFPRSSELSKFSYGANLSNGHYSLV